eukprot:GHVS01016120.1.p1 GENE.GHVS01016120.1~~GHVS01016120.1.p1  ORF type:complete len:604 (+),score=99.36 GHVS01016120.1:83-1894(+)
MASARAPACSAVSWAAWKLPAVEMGKAVVRFPPEPSGYLHIGHAKAALLNSSYARQYQGVFVLRFDDTNPAKEKMEFEDSIKEDLKMLQIVPTRVTHTSDYFDELAALMTKLIQEGKAYADCTPPEQMKEERGEGIESSCRSQCVEENERLWAEMQQGSEEGKKCCVRLKLNMKDKNKCMRDPTMYRCVADVPHHRHGFRFKVYPTYDFACPIVDSMEGITLALRTNEYADRIPQYKKVLELTGMRNVTIYEFSRLNFIRTVLSKRKLQWFVDNKLVPGWDDPRFPTVRGIIRRGLRVEALEEFLLEQGPSKAANLMEWDKLWAKNKQLIDPVAQRYMAVACDEKVPFELSDGPNEVETKLRDLHPKDPSVGQTKQYFSKRVFLELDDAQMCVNGEEVTLMRWGNAVIDEIVRDEGDKIQLLKGHLNLEGDFKKTKKKLHWLADMETCDLAAVHKRLTKCVLREYDHLIVPDKIDKDDNRPISEFVNPTTQYDTLALADAAVADLPHGTVIQFERRGYFRIDQLAHSVNNGVTGQAAAEEAGGLMVLIKIPDGKAKAVSAVSAKVGAAALSGAKPKLSKSEKAEAKKEKKQTKKDATEEAVAQ